MARARSPEKRQALLDSAIREIAEAGLGASTARIAKGADLAEGTLFTYFDSKDELLNVLYFELKTAIYRRVLAGFPKGSSLRERARHIWTEYLRWAIEKPEERTVSRLLHLSLSITSATREQTDSERGDIAHTLEELGKHGAFKTLPAGFTASAMSAMQEAVLEVAARKPRQKVLVGEQAFEAFWRMAK
jgi:AcrR family transcriptional regulator